MCGFISLADSIDPYTQHRRGLRTAKVATALSVEVSAGRLSIHRTHRQGEIIALRPSAAAAQAQVLPSPRGKGRVKSARAARMRQTSAEVS